MKLSGNTGQQHINESFYCRSRHLWLAALLSLLTLISIPAPAADLNLPDLGDSTSAFISHEKEYEMGQAWLRLFRNRVPYYEDPQLQHYLEQLVKRIAIHSKLKNKSLQVIAVDNPTLNAFAAPGGIIGINSGLLLLAENEGEIASVIAHELAHLSQRHWARSMEAAKENSVPTLAGLLAGLILMASSNGQAGAAAIATTQAANLDSALRFSRQNEEEADNIGMHNLVASGFDPAAMTDMFEHMLATHRFQGRRPPEYLLSHPVTEKRVASSRLRARQLANPNDHNIDYSLTEDQSTTNIFTDEQKKRYHLMRARVQLHHSETPQQAIKRFQSEIDGDTLDIDASRYGLALAQIKAGQYQQAKDTLNALQEKYPSEMLYPMALAEIALLIGESREARNLAQAIISKNSTYTPAKFLLAKIHLSTKQYDDAEQILYSLSQQRPEDPHVWYQLAEVRGLSQNIPGLHLARAEYYILYGVYDRARTQLEYAQNLLKGNYVWSEKIKQRLIEVERLENISLEI